ncbi:unnamed protein product [Nesidiocoris tenuis]|uniref:Uncharacterized protein n=1 Tax=Nesidiocoris tenuis TaxID=355587 RepID=A0A6H5G5E9_9HEMI|nr:unnamed protein product [Nesidiocoris tenuis]
MSRAPNVNGERRKKFKLRQWHGTAKISNHFWIDSLRELKKKNVFPKKKKIQTYLLGKNFTPVLKYVI